MPLSRTLIALIPAAVILVSVNQALAKTSSRPEAGAPPDGILYPWAQSPEWNPVLDRQEREELKAAAIAAALSSQYPDCIAVDRRLVSRESIQEQRERFIREYRSTPHPDWAAQAASPQVAVAQAIGSSGAVYRHASGSPELRFVGGNTGNMSEGSRSITTTLRLSTDRMSVEEIVFENVLWRRQNFGAVDAPDFRIVPSIERRGSCGGPNARAPSPTPARAPAQAPAQTQASVPGVPAGAEARPRLPSEPSNPANGLGLPPGFSQ